MKKIKEFRMISSLLDGASRRMKLLSCHDLRCVKAEGGAGFGWEIRTSVLGLLYIEMSILHPYSDAGYISLEFKEKIWIGNVNLGVIST